MDDRTNCIFDPALPLNLLIVTSRLWYELTHLYDFLPFPFLPKEEWKQYASLNFP